MSLIVCGGPTFVVSRWEAVFLRPTPNGALLAYYTARTRVYYTAPIRRVDLAVQAHNQPGLTGPARQAN